MITVLWTLLLLKEIKYVVDIPIAAGYSGDKESTIFPSTEIRQ
jgi:hypothetical protein